MSWRVVVRPEALNDIDAAADWYETKQQGLGDEFIEEVLSVLDCLAENPLIYCRRHPQKNICWRYPDRFPYHIIYEVQETDNTVVVAAVLHAAQHDSHWRKRV
jgi:toxin ParE1/3/4